MAHKKKRENTQVLVYKYGATPLSELPQAFWDTAKEMQRVWNALVGMRNRLTDNFTRLGLGGKEHRDARTEIWRHFDRLWKDFVNSAEIKAKLGGDEREFIIQKFETADRKAKKDKTGLKKQFALDRINFRHRYSGGGKPLASFKTMAGDKFAFEFPDDVFYWSDRHKDRRRRIGTGSFGVLKDRSPVFSFEFSAVIHRELPEGAIVKSVSWVGKRLKGRGFTKTHLPESQRDWIWSIDVAVEVPQAEKEAFYSGRTAALDMGWRKISDDLLRIGAIQDASGNRFEICLPCRSESNAVKDGSLAGSLQDIFALDEQKGLLVEETKNKLKEVGVAHLTKMREGGLFRLRRALTESGENAPAMEILDAFAERFLPLQSRRARSFDRLQNYRNWIYRNVAKWLASNFDALVWEKNLGLKKIAEEFNDLTDTETSDAAYRNEKRRRAAARYRQFASLYTLRLYIKQAFDKAGKPILEADPLYIRQQCSDCGEFIEDTVEQEIFCPQGHRFDGDFNETENMLAQFRDDFIFTASDAPPVPNSPNCDLSAVIVPLESRRAAIA